MADEKKNVQDAKAAPETVNAKDLQITVPNIFDTKNPDIKMVSIVDPSSQNGFRTFGINAQDIVKQRTTKGPNGKVNVLSTIQLRDDPNPNEGYDTSVLSGYEADGSPKYDHKKLSGSAIKKLFDEQKALGDNAKQVVAPAPVAPKAADKPKPIILNGFSLRNDITFVTKDNKTLARVKIPDPASACGHGWLSVPEGNVFQQHADRPDERNVNLREPGTKLYYQIQGPDGKWGEKMKEDGTPFTKEDLRDQWKEHQAAKRATRTAALDEKVADMAKPAPDKQSEADDAFENETLF